MIEQTSACGTHDDLTGRAADRARWTDRDYIEAVLQEETRAFERLLQDIGDHLVQTAVEALGAHKSEDAA